jgi:Ca2+/Na+ antiporter
VRALIWSLSLFVNAAIAIGLAAFSLDSEPSLTAKTVAGSLSLCFLVVTGVLAWSRFAQLPQWASKAFSAWCLALPVAFFLGSLDRGIYSGQEALATVLIAALAWFTRLSYGSKSGHNREQRLGDEPN